MWRSPLNARLGISEISGVMSISSTNLTSSPVLADVLVGPTQHESSTVALTHRSSSSEIEGDVSASISAAGDDRDAHHPMYLRPPPGFDQVQSTSRPGELSYRCRRTRRRYGSLRLAWAVYWNPGLTVTAPAAATKRGVLGTSSAEGEIFTTREFLAGSAVLNKESREDADWGCGDDPDAADINAPLHPDEDPDVPPLPSGFEVVPSHSREGQRAFLDPATHTRYSTAALAWAAYRRREKALVFAQQGVEELLEQHNLTDSADHVDEQFFHRDRGEEDVEAPQQRASDGARDERRLAPALPRQEDRDERDILKLLDPVPDKELSDPHRPAGADKELSDPHRPAGSDNGVEGTAPRGLRDPTMDRGAGGLRDLTVERGAGGLRDLTVERKERKERRGVSALGEEQSAIGPRPGNSPPALVVSKSDSPRPGSSPPALVASKSDSDQGDLSVPDDLEDPPTGFDVTASKSRPGQLTYVDMLTGRRYASLQRARKIYEERRKTPGGRAESPPPGWKVVPSTHRPGYSVFVDVLTQQRYDNVGAAWAVYRERAGPPSTLGSASDSRPGSAEDGLPDDGGGGAAGTSAAGEAPLVAPSDDVTQQEQQDVDDSPKSGPNDEAVRSPRGPPPTMMSPERPPRPAPEGRGISVRQRHSRFSPAAAQAEGLFVYPGSAAGAAVSALENACRSAADRVSGLEKELGRFTRELGLARDELSAYQETARQLAFLYTRAGRTGKGGAGGNHSFGLVWGRRK